METLLFFVGAALICGLWFFLQMKLFAWADEKQTLLSTVIAKISLYLLSASITMVGFVAVMMFVQMLVNAMFGT